MNGKLSKDEEIGDLKRTFAEHESAMTTVADGLDQIISSINAGDAAEALRMALRLSDAAKVIRDACGLAARGLGPS